MWVPKLPIDTEEPINPPTVSEPEMLIHISRYMQNEEPTPPLSESASQPPTSIELPSQIADAMPGSSQTLPNKVLRRLKPKRDQSRRPSRKKV